MIPNAEQIIVARYILRGLARLVGILILPTALVPWISWWIEGVRDGDLLSFGYYAPRMISGGILAIVGLGLFFLGGPLSRWVLPVPGKPPGCPKCGYSLSHLTEPRCPECGLTLRAGPAADHTDHPPTEPAESPVGD